MALFRKGGGGFLHNVDGTITGYQFTDEFNGEPFKAGKNKEGKEKFHSLFGYVTVRVDGADEDVSVNLFAGGADDYEVSEDGYSVDRQLGTGGFSTFIESAAAQSPELEEKLEALQGLNFEPLIGARVRFVQVENAETTKKLGRVADKKDPKKSYARKDLTVEAVYSLAAGKPAGKAAKTAKGKAAVADTSVADLAAATLLDILGDNDGKVTIQQLSVKTLNKLMKHKDREAVRKLYTEAFFETVDGVTYDAATKTVGLSA